MVEGRAAAGQPPSAHPRLWVFDRVGTKLADFELPLPSPGSLGLGPEVAPGRVVVSSYRGLLLSEDALVVDVASGEVVDKLSLGSGPRSAFPWAPRHAALGAGSSVHFFSDDDGRGVAHPGRLLNRVVRIDFATGERKVVAGPGAAARRADQRALSVWSITSRARPDASARSADERLRLEPESGLERRAQPRGVSRHQDRRAHAAAHHHVRGGEAGDAAVRVVERQDLDEAREGDGGRLIGREIARAGHLQPLGERREAALDELGRRGRGAVPLALPAAQAHRPRERLVPRADRREAERRVVGHGRPRAAQREDLRRALAQGARGTHVVPGEAKARELEAPEKLRVLDDPARAPGRPGGGRAPRAGSRGAAP